MHVPDATGDGWPGSTGRRLKADSPHRIVPALAKLAEKSATWRWKCKGVRYNIGLRLWLAYAQTRPGLDGNDREESCRKWLTS